MSALFESGFFVGEAPWHGMGEIVPANTRYSVSEGLIAAGMNWDVYTLPVGTMTAKGWWCPMDDVTDKKGNVTGQRPHEVYTMRRMLVDGVEQEQRLGTVGGGYEVVQNHQIFDWFQPYLEKNEATLHTAGSLNCGRWVWCLAKLNRKPLEVAPGDFVEKFLLLSSSHDGSLCLRVGFTPIRVVCANTLAMAHNDAKSQLLRLRHTKMVHASLDEVHDIVNVMDANFEATAEQYRHLADRKVVSQKDMARFVVRVLTNDNPPEDGLSTKMENIVVSVCDRLNNKANTIGGIGGTWWAAYNAITEHLTWAAGGEGGEKTSPQQKANNRLASLWLGKGHATNDLALQIAVEMAA